MFSSCSKDDAGYGGVFGSWKSETSSEYPNSLLDQTKPLAGLRTHQIQRMERIGFPDQTCF